MLLVLAFAQEDHSKRRAPATGGRWAALLSDSITDLHELRANRPLRAALVLTFLMQLGLNATNPLLELFVRDTHAFFGWVRPNTAILFSTMAGATLIATPMWGVFGDRRGAYPALVICAVWSALAMLLHAIAPNYEALVLVRVAFGAAMAGSGPLAFGIAATESSAEQRGGAIGVVFAARTLSVAFAAMLGGWASSYIGVRGLFVASAALVLGYLLLLRRSNARADIAISRGR
jgi:DHA1 family multidrug resistance protein-like MFS transporter